MELRRQCRLDVPELDEHIAHIAGPKTRAGQMRHNLAIPG